LAELLSRYAEAIFWMARYVERAENLVRILDACQSSAGARGHADEWRVVLDINSDGGRFADQGRQATAAEVLRFYVLDEENPTSIRSAVRGMFENARTLRPFISTELWTQINVFRKKIREMGPAHITPSALPRLFALVKESCQTHTGIAEGTFHRDQGWYFYQLGRYLERADQTTRLLDARFIRYRAGAEPDTPMEAGKWGTLLNCAAGYHAFRRSHPSGIVPRDIAAFLLFDAAFPRSVALCITEVDRLLTALRSRYGLRGGIPAMERLDEVKGALFQHTPESVLTTGLHDYLDWLQHHLIGVTNALATDFFGTMPVSAQQQQQ
jgi:uncharacterized alpha-E superfamily protein